MGFLFKVENLFVQTKLPIEAADTSAGVHHFLLTSEKGVTLGADFHLNIRPGRAGFDHVATSALDCGWIVVGMNAFLHEFSPLSPKGS
jgi:hypothetical protein